MVILGLNCYHGDSSACLVIDGKLVCAIEEERIRRIKHWAGFPSESIKWCLSYGNIRVDRIDYIALSRNPRARLMKKTARAIFKRKSFSFYKDRFSNYAKLGSIKEELAAICQVEPGNIKAKVIFVDHHLAHLASSFLVSPYEQAAIISVDGFGDFLSTMLAGGGGNRIKVIKTIEYPHSLGIFYSAMTQAAGFWNYGDEYKVMGLSAYGKPVYMEAMRKIVRTTKTGLFELDTSFFNHDTEGVEMTWLGEAPVVGKLFSDKLSKIVGPARNKGEELATGDRFCDIAASTQGRYEEVFFGLLEGLAKKVKTKTICLSGGCIQNSLANGKIYGNSPFRDIYIPPAAHDGGTSIGAAFYVWNVILKKPRTFVMASPYWGPSFADMEIEETLRKSGLRYQKLNEEELIRKTAQAIADGKIVGWFRGRTEWGPRALGNRSILVDPRKREMMDVLNARIKRREWFRPFAPSILEEHTKEWFELFQPVPFMEKVYKIKPEKQGAIQAVTHVDGTGRLQTVSRQTNPLYHELISVFYRLTGVPIVLNTSFNENEPIVNSPQDAIDCFARVGMDFLAVGDYFVSKIKQPDNILAQNRSM